MRTIRAAMLPTVMRTQKRTRVWVLAITAALVVAAVAVGGWWWTAARTADDVQVTLVDDRPHCTGTDVTYDDELGSPVIEAAPGMHCAYRIRVDNTSDHAIRLHLIVAPGVGPETGAVVTADPSGDPRPHGIVHGLDAAYPLDRSLPAGKSATFDVALVFHPEGCNSAGTAWMDPWPSVEFESLHHTFTRAAPAVLAFHQRDSTPGC